MNIEWVVELLLITGCIGHTRSSHEKFSVKKVLLEISQNSQENTCVGVSFLIKLQGSGLQLYKKGDSGTGAFLEFCDISQNTYSYRTPLVAASLTYQGYG